MIDPLQLLRCVIEPALSSLGDKYASEQAARLVLATAAQESHCGKYLRQLGGGPALGYLQMEPATLHDLYVSYLCFRPQLLDVVGAEDSQRLVYDLRYATWCARLQFYRFPDPLPAANDCDGMFALYKRRYNGPGAATIEEWRKNWARFVWMTAGFIRRPAPMNC